MGHLITQFSVLELASFGVICPFLSKLCNNLALTHLAFFCNTNELLLLYVSLSFSGFNSLLST